MDKRDGRIYKYPRRGGPDLSVRNQNPSSVDNKVEQPPWKLGISSSSGERNQNPSSVDNKVEQPPWKLGISSSSGGSHIKSPQSHSTENPSFPTVDTTKSVRRSSSRTLSTRPFEERQKLKQSFVGESSSSSIGTATGKTVTQVLTNTDDVLDFDPSVWAQGIGSSSGSRFLSQRNTQINLGSSSSGTGTGMHRRGIKSLGCTSASDVIPSNAEGVRKRVHGEGSSTRARSLTSMAAGLNVPTTTRGVPQAENRISRVLARTGETEFWALQADRTLSSSQEDQREEEEEEDDEEDEEEPAQPSRFAFLLPPQLSASSRSRSESGSGFVSGPASHSTSDSASGISGRMVSRSGEEESGRTSHQVVQRGLRLRDREASQRDGIAEVLLALERIEQHGELGYVEQLLMLETNMLLHGLTFHDEHRGMRMDIDNMSYEELLALGEQMGTVSTALSEEEFANCLKRSVYHESTSHCIADVKCSICQEEYEDGVEIGMLKCEHWYHVSCIHEWLSQKNWCPVCKASQKYR